MSIPKVITVETEFHLEKREDLKEQGLTKLSYKATHKALPEKSIDFDVKISEELAEEASEVTIKYAIKSMVERELMEAAFDHLESMAAMKDAV